MEDTLCPHFDFLGYGASKDGFVYNLHSGRRLKGNPKQGYYYVRLYPAGMPHADRSVHRFVYECFSGRPIAPGMQIDHVNGVKTDNTYHNLQEMTASAHAIKTRKDNRQMGDKASMARSRPILQYPVGGSIEDATLHATGSHAARNVPGTLQSKISKCARGLVTQHAGFIWKFVEDPDMEGEEWRECGESRALVSSCGRVKHRNGKKTYGTINGDGYMYVKIAGRQHYIHRLVCEAFCGLPMSKAHKSVDHIDSNRKNNVPTNLRWSTWTEQQENRWERSL